MSAGILAADWNHWPDGLEPEAIAPLAARLGCAGLELGVYDASHELSPARVHTWRRLAERHEVPVRMILLSLPRARWPSGALTEPDALARVLRQAAAVAGVAAELGLATVGLWPGADLPAAGAWGRLVSAAGALTDAVRPYGVRIALEPKPGTVLGDALGVLRLLDELPARQAAWLGVLVDTGHEHAAGTDVGALPGLLGDRLLHVHVGDAAGAEPDADLPPGRLHDHRPFLLALAASGYAGAVTPDLYGYVAGGAASGEEALGEALAHLRAGGAAGGAGPS